eukprot:2886429-Pyramimonas_sp.AAC.1
MDTGKMLSEHSGVRGESLTKRLATVHGIAPKYMHELIDTERKPNGRADEELEKPRLGIRERQGNTNHQI